jgi:hypothetical protein
MGEKLRILILEDVPTDAELQEHELRSAGYSFTCERVDTRDAFLDALDRFAPDVVLADYQLPQFDGMTALRLTRERHPEIPVVMVTGSINEETAVECIKAGAVDYVLKNHLRRLAPAVEGALERRRERETRERAEQALQRSEAQYRGLVENATYGIYRSTVGGKFLTVNRALVEMLGYASEAELLAADLADLYEDPNQRTRFIEEARIADGIKRVETVWKRKDGGSITMRLSPRVIRDAGGELQGFDVIAEDVTERRALEAQLRQAQKLEAVGRLAGGVAHDFNNILTVVLGESEMALADLPSDHPLRDPLQEIHDAGTRAGGLTRQLLAFSRKQIIEPVIFNLNELVIGVDKMLQRLIGEDVELVTRTPSDPVVVNADRGQIEQVLMNLAVNARDAMPQGGQLVIETDNITLDEDYALSHADVDAGDYALISVSDTGTGMTAQVKARLFEPFFTTKDSEHGTGLGLAVCYGIAKQFGGHIGVYSEPGLGTTMKVYLPSAEDPTEALLEAVAETRPCGSETILLVEDEEPVRRTGMRILRAHGYKVLEAGNGEQALQLLERAEQRVQLLLCDLVLPKMGGRVVAERVRELLPDIKVLFVSGYTDDVILRNQLLERSVALLKKPFTPSTLAFKVREVLDGGPRDMRRTGGEA